MSCALLSRAEAQDVNMCYAPFSFLKPAPVHTNIDERLLEQYFSFPPKQRRQNLIVKNREFRKMLFESRYVSLNSHNLTVEAMVIRDMIHKEGCDASFLVRSLK